MHYFFLQPHCILIYHQYNIMKNTHGSIRFFLQFELAVNILILKIILHKRFYKQEN